MSDARHTRHGAATATVASLLLFLLSGCAAEKPAPKPAAAAAPPPPPPVSLTQIKSELQQAQAQLQLTTESLNKLHKSSAADADANYNAFTTEYLKMKSKAEVVTSRADEVRARAKAYFAMWDKQAEVQNPELRRQAVQQRAAAERQYNDVVSEIELTRLGFQPYMANLADAGNYLRGRLNPATLASMSDLVAKANEQSKEVNTHLNSILGSIDTIAAGTGDAGGAAAGGTASGGAASAPPSPAR